jgi:hypothetical protein
MPRLRFDMDRTTRLLAALGGGVMLYAAGVAAHHARLHMAIMGTLCGSSPNDPHCGWCLAAVSLGLAALTAVIFAVRPDVTRNTVRAAPITVAKAQA